MSMIQHLAKAAATGAIALLIATSSSAAREAEQRSAPASRLPAVAQGPKIAVNSTKSAATTPKAKKSARAEIAQPAATQDKKHRLILQVNTNDPAAMNLALNNATNVAQYYKQRGEKVKIEVVTFGPGLHMLRDDTSPVKARIELMALSTPEVSFKACGNTKENMQKAESKDIPIIAQAEVVKSGVVRVMELEEQGWTYVKP
jgi:intracellular sulfur oxidation DsrE/DsrF family protein